MTTAVAEAPPASGSDRFYAAVRLIARFWLWFFFKRVDARHSERVPERGPVLLCINHPNNLIDSLLVGAVLTRKAHYLATAALFRNPLLARFLAACGAMPVYRRQDDPDKMAVPAAGRTWAAGRAAARPGAGAPAREASESNSPHASEASPRADRNADVFAACHRAFAEGRLIAIYPEGTTHAEARVQRIRTGAARIALGYEVDHPGALRVIPVGLSFEARKSFKGRVLVSFGEPIPIAAYVAAYRADAAKAVEALTTAIQWAMEAQVVHVDRIETAEVVRAVEELYRGDLIRELREERGLADTQIDLFRLSRTIVDAVQHFKAREPERVERIWQRIQGYRALLRAYRVKDEAVQARLGHPPTRRRLRRTGGAIAGFPIFLYGAAVNALPYFVPRWLARATARKETDYATTRLLASIVAFPLFWGLEVWLVARLAGRGWAALFTLSLPLTGVVAYHYFRGLGRLRRALRFGVLALTRDQVARELIAERGAVIAELDRAKTDYLTATRGSSF
jgi:1-acyl-sn-glycerol-3-phosphate acyltransferase